MGEGRWQGEGGGRAATPLAVAMNGWRTTLTDSVLGSDKLLDKIYPELYLQ